MSLEIPALPVDNLLERPDDTAIPSSQEELPVLAQLMKPGLSPRQGTMKARVTIVEMIYHQAPGDQPTVVDPSCTFELDSDEQVFCRKFNLGPEWRALPYGWLRECSFALIANHGKDVVELSTTEDEPVPDWQIEGGHDMRASPTCLDKIKLRCVGDHTRVSVTLYPK